MRVEDFDDSPPAWNASLERLAGATFCHLYGWRSVMEDALGHETYWWIARSDEGNVEGLLPLVHVRSRLFGDYLVSMPFLNYGGPVGSAEARAALARHAADEAAELGVDLLELRDRLELSAEPLVRNARKLTVVKTLPDTTEELWEKGLRSKVRSQVRRPMKEGMDVRVDGDLVEPFYDVFAATMRDLGTPVLPRRFFESIRTHLDDASLIVVVELDGAPLAAGFGLFWNGELEITWAGASREHARLAPNMLLYWGMMEEAVRRGMDSFNFGRCTPGSGTHKFKRQWGTEDHELPWHQWSPTGVDATPNPDSAKFRAATRVWQKLPVGVTRRIGPPLARVIP